MPSVKNSVIDFIKNLPGGIKANHKLNEKFY